MSGQHASLIDELVHEAKRASGTTHSSSVPEPSPLREALGTIAASVEGEAIPVATVREAIATVYQHLDAEHGLLSYPVENAAPLPERLRELSASTPFVLFLLSKPTPQGFYDTPLGLLIRQALSLMMDIEEIRTPEETAEELGVGRQSVYNMAKRGVLFPLCKAVATGKGMLISSYLVAQIQQVKEAREALYTTRAQPGPKRAERR